jgi:hypothetical protein
MLADLISRDAHLIVANCRERSLTHQWAGDRSSYFEKYDVDCEYKRNGFEVKSRRAPYTTCHAVELATLKWVSSFNHHRLLAAPLYAANRSVGKLLQATEQSSRFGLTLTNRPPRKRGRFTPTALSAAHTCLRLHATVLLLPPIKRLLRCVTGGRCRPPSSWNNCEVLTQK